MAKFLRTILPETRKRAEQGDLDAQFELGLFYWTGRGLQKDKNEALAVWQTLAAKGHVKANYMVGLAFVKQERFQEALELFRAAAAGNLAAAMYEAGILFYEALLKDAPDYGKALYWFKKADRAGHKQACRYLAQIFYNGEGAPRNAALSAHYYEKSACNNDSESQYKLGLMHLRGSGVKRNYFTARKWLARSAAHGHKYANYMLGLMYFHGRGVSQDYAKAKSFFEKAAYISPLINNLSWNCFLPTPWKDSVPDALCKLCEMHANGLGLPADIREAARMYCWARLRSEKKANACWLRLAETQREEIAKILLAEEKAKAAEARRARELRLKRKSLRPASFRQINYDA